MRKLFGGRVVIRAPQIMVLGFAGVILAGALLLSLPVSAADGTGASFLDALFTATTSVCVTGLVVQDTGTYWSGFGQGVILLLIQVGGLGVITVAASFSLAAGRKIDLFQRQTLQEAVAAPQLGGIVRLTGFLLKATFLMEFLGALLLAPVFVRDFGLSRGLWMAVFHGISAFCNAGLDLTGTVAPFSSLTAYRGSVLVNGTIMALIVAGGLGFLTWEDIRSHGLAFRKYRMQTKVILTATAGLIFIPAALFFLLEYRDLPLKDRVLASLFQSVTARTAGFNTADLGAMSESGQLAMIFLMLIGGSPGSTAGGMKTTTFAVLLACGAGVFRKGDDTQLFGRRVAQEAVSTAVTLACLYIGLSVGCAMVISRLEGLPLLTCLYETASAVATVGLSQGITPGLGTASRWMLMGLMFLGRVGGLTLVYAASSGRKQVGKLPLEKITVG
ncbi:MAG: potassium transporter TrkG [Eubacteriales bacterium]|nr:potassium transporter TrkG [Eubacteriales bacterium]